MCDSRAQNVPLGGYRQFLSTRFGCIGFGCAVLGLVFLFLAAWFARVGIWGLTVAHVLPFGLDTLIPSGVGEFLAVPFFALTGLGWVLAGSILIQFGAAIEKRAVLEFWAKAGAIVGVIAATLCFFGGLIGTVFSLIAFGMGKWVKVANIVPDSLSTAMPLWVSGTPTLWVAIGALAIGIISISVATD